MKKILAFIVVLCIGIGCTETPVSPTTEVSVLNDQTSDSAVTKVVITVTNESHRNVYFTHSKNLIGFWGLERKVGEGWVDADRAAIEYTSIYSKERKMLAHGEILCDSLTISQAGAYRMVFPFAWDEKGTEVDSLPTEEFVVR